jgi:hypothetical protein
VIYIVQNIVPILIATIAGLAFGALYDRLFRQPRGTGTAAARSTGFVVTSFLAEAWFAAILAGALILAPAKAGNWTMALGTAVVIWIGFVVPVLVVTLSYRELPRRVVLLDCGHWLGLMLVQAVVLKLVGLTAPVV